MSACRSCQSRADSVRVARAEVTRLARMMARSERNERRLAGELVQAKSALAFNLTGQRDHEAECEAAA